MSSKPDLSGRVVLVTGASRGIGAAVRLALAQVGADLVVNYRERADAAARVVERIAPLGRRAVALQADVSSAVQVTGLLVAVERALGAVDVPW